MNVDGVINFLKPSGMTSHDAVGYMRRLLKIKKIGHTGTLDPMAAGVLPLCVGRGTRIVEYLIEDNKRYRCELRLGLTTDTLDVWGVKTGGRGDIAAALSESAIIDAVCSFTGALQQIPPMYSAVKIGGKKLYEYARKGASIEAPPRDVYIKSIIVKKVNLCDLSLIFDVECSKGAYIRSICRDIGDKLGCGAVMSGLVRLNSGAFAIEDSFTADELEHAVAEGRGAELLTPIDRPLSRFIPVEIDSEDDCRKFVNGLAMNTEILRFSETADTTNTAADKKFRDYYRVYGSFRGIERAFLGVGRIEEGKLHADKVFIGSTI
ncbi:MAG: tRNA pseudouridine(55) synthase TruB [Clostridiales Family XIII bacterium]|jgi:tRNA pseudouridine55 synthase|nr:tRNA pseudouridine(55) synthase TruB [Clostridiales Family XIII bacterium]